MTTNSRITVIALMFAVPDWLLGQVSMRAGLWENTVASGGQSVTRNACITADQERHSKDSVETMRKSIEEALGKGGGCTLKEFTVAGAIRTEVMVCGKATIKNTTTFHGDSFETIGTSTTGDVVKSSVTKGKRLGDCPAGGVK